MLLVQKFLRTQNRWIMSISVESMQLFINKMLKSCGTATVSQAVTYDPVTTPLYGVHFFSTLTVYFSD